MRKARGNSSGTVATQAMVTCRASDLKEASLIAVHFTFTKITWERVALVSKNDVDVGNGGIVHLAF